MSTFQEGDAVKCVSDDFPYIPEYGGNPNNLEYPKPKIGENLIVDEVLGEFLRFDIYDTDQSFNWWHQTRFIHVKDTTKESNLISIEKCL